MLTNWDEWYIQKDSRQERKTLSAGCGFAFTLFIN